MKAGKKVFILFIAILLLASVASPAMATPATANDNVEVVVLNKTGEIVRLQLIGTFTYYFNLAPGKNTLTLPEDTYKYSYTLCEKAQTGVFKVKKKGQCLNCPSAKQVQRRLPRKAPIPCS